MTTTDYEMADNRLDKTDETGIIFVHGATGSSQTWKFQLEGLSKKIKVIAVNLPGHMCAEREELPSMEMYTEALNELLKELQLKRVILAGHSMGGSVVMTYYLQHPDKVQGLVLIGTGARLKVLPMILKTIQENYQEFIKFSKSFSFCTDTIKENTAIIKEIEENMAKISPRIAHRDFEICNEFDIMAQLGEIKVPTLIIVGDKDKLTPVKYSTYMKEHIEESELTIIKEAGHMVMLEKSEAVNRAIADFLESI